MPNAKHGEAIIRYLWMFIKKYNWKCDKIIVYIDVKGLNMQQIGDFKC